MKRTLKIALSVVLGAAMVVPALAQSDAFPDTPENHWAFDALKEMKNNGLLVGYPDGLFRGPRPASRYELAVAIHATYKHLKNITDGLDSRISDLKRQVDNIKVGPGGVSQEELDNLKKGLADLQGQMGNMKAWGDDIANLKKLASTFEKELSSMGVDVEALKKGMSDLADRVGALEKRKLPVDIHGDLGFAVFMGYSDDEFGVTRDGRPTGYGRGDYSGQPVGATRDVSVIHEAAVTLSGTNDEGPKWGFTVVNGNALDFFNGQNTLNSGSPFDDDVDSEFYIHNAWVKFDTSLVGQGFSATVGRLGVKVSPYIFQKQDTTPDYRNSRFDDGNFMVDGGSLDFRFGGAKLNVFGGRVNSQSGTDFNGIQSMFAGQSGLMPNRVLGTTLGVPLTQNGELNLAYLWLDSDNVIGSSPGVNRVNVFGGDVNFNFGKIMLNGGFSQSDERYNTTSINTDNNTAWYAKAGYNSDKWGIKAWYRNIEENFAAPGDWGRIAWFYNPTNIKGWGAGAHLDLTESVRLWASGEMYEPENGSGNDVDIFKAGLGYKLNSNSKVGVSWENVKFDSTGSGGDPRVTWWNIGFDHMMGGNSSLSINWQISDFDGKGSMTTPFGSDTAKGGLITTQLNVRF